MSITLILHIANEDPVLCEVEELPDVHDQIIIVHNPRLRDGKDLHYLSDEVTMMILPWHRVTFIEVMPSSQDLDDVITFVREQ
jgi:hypothetical protein